MKGNERHIYKTSVQHKRIILFYLFGVVVFDVVYTLHRQYVSRQFDITKSTTTAYVNTNRRNDMTYSNTLNSQFNNTNSDLDENQCDLLYIYRRFLHAKKEKKEEKKDSKRHEKAV